MGKNPTTSHCLRLTMADLALKLCSFVQEGFVIRFHQTFNVRCNKRGITMSEVMYGKEFCKRAKSADLAVKQKIQRSISKREARLAQLLRNVMLENPTGKRKTEYAESERVLESEILRLKLMLRYELH